MIAPGVLQAELVAILQGDTPLTAALAEGAAGIKEQEWRGIAFSYPAVRVTRAQLTPYGNGNCAGRLAIAEWTVTAFSKKDSSVTAQEVQGLIVDALDGVVMETSALRTIPLRPVTVLAVQPVAGEDAWFGAVTFRTLVTQK